MVVVVAVVGCWFLVVGFWLLLVVVGVLLSVVVGGCWLLLLVSLSAQVRSGRVQSAFSSLFMACVID